MAELSNLRHITLIEQWFYFLLPPLDIASAEYNPSGGNQLAQFLETRTGKGLLQTMKRKDSSEE